MSPGPGTTSVAAGRPLDSAYPHASWVTAVSWRAITYRRSGWSAIARFRGRVIPPGIPKTTSIPASARHPATASASSIRPRRRPDPKVYGRRSDVR